MIQTFREFLHALTADEREVLATYRPLAHKHVVLTGKLADAMVREEAAKWLYAWGAVIDTAVVPSTDILLAVDPARMTQKRRDADRFRVTVLDEPEFTMWLRTMLAEAESARSRLEGLAPPPPEAYFPEPPEVEEYEDRITPLSDFGG